MLNLVWSKRRRTTETRITSTRSWYGRCNRIKYGILSSIHVIILDGHYRELDGYNDERSCRCRYIGIGRFVLCDKSRLFRFINRS